MDKIVPLNRAITAMCRATAAVHPTNVTLAWTIYKVPAFFLAQRQADQVAYAYPLTLARLMYWFGDAPVNAALHAQWPETINRDKRMILEALFKRVMMHVDEILDSVSHPADWPSLPPASTESLEIARILLAFEDFFTKAMESGEIPDTEEWWKALTVKVEPQA